MGLSLCKEFGCCCTKDSSVRSRRRSKKKKNRKRRHSRQRRRSSLGDPWVEPYAPATPRGGIAVAPPASCPPPDSDRRAATTATSPRLSILFMARDEAELAVVSPMTDDGIDEGDDEEYSHSVATTTRRTSVSDDDGSWEEETINHLPYGSSSLIGTAARGVDGREHCNGRTMALLPQGSHTGVDGGGGGDAAVGSSWGRPISAATSDASSADSKEEDLVHCSTSTRQDGRIVVVAHHHGEEGMGCDEEEEEEEKYEDTAEDDASQWEAEEQEEEECSSSSDSSVNSPSTTDGDSDSTGPERYHSRHHLHHPDGIEPYDGATTASSSVLTSELLHNVHDGNCSHLDDCGGDAYPFKTASTDAMEEDPRCGTLRDVWMSALAAAAAAAGKSSWGCGSRSANVARSSVHRLPTCSVLLALLPEEELKAREAYRTSTYNTATACRCAVCPSCGVCSHHIRWCATGRRHRRPYRTQHQPQAYNRDEPLTADLTGDASPPPASASSCTLLPSLSWISAQCFPLQVPADSGGVDDFERRRQWFSLDRLVDLIGSFAPDWCAVLEEYLVTRCFALLDTIVWSGALCCPAHAACGGLPKEVSGHDVCALRFVIRRGGRHLQPSLLPTEASEGLRFPFQLLLVPSSNAVGGGSPVAKTTATFSARIVTLWRNDFFTSPTGSSGGCLSMRAESTKHQAVSAETMTALFEAMTIVLIDRERNTSMMKLLKPVTKSDGVARALPRKTAPVAVVAVSDAKPHRLWGGASQTSAVSLG